jgi:hypothetical protein
MREAALAAVFPHESKYEEQPTDKVGLMADEESEWIYDGCGEGSWEKEVIAAVSGHV